MVYHSFRVPESAGLSPMEKFDHIVRVRNRAMGQSATKLSSHLSVEISDMNREILQLDVNDINMHEMIQNSTCQIDHKKSFVVKCTLDSLGRLSGLWDMLPQRREGSEGHQSRS